MDLVITRSPSLNCFFVTRGYHSAECDTDQSLVSSKVRLQPKRTHRLKQKARPRINEARTSIPDLCECFVNTIEDALKACPTNSAEERWNFTRDTIYKCPMDTFGKKEKKNPDWFKAGIATLEPAITAKRVALLNYKRESHVRGREESLLV